MGQLVGATPWKQEMMLLLGVLVSALVIPPIMQLLFNVYGIGGIMPHEGMNVSQSLPAPAAALMAAVTEAVFSHTMPWAVLLTGVFTMCVLLVISRLFLNRFFHVSILGVAIGMYLPLTTSVPIFLGGMIAACVSQRAEKRAGTPHALQTSVLIACGLVAGAAVMDVLLAIPFSIFQSPNILALVGVYFTPIALVLALVSTGLLARWMIRG